MVTHRRSGQLIPRIIHRLWLGPNPQPEIFEYYERSWRRHHPEWELRTWRDHMLPPLICQAEFDGQQSIKKRIDMVRLEIIRQVGGVFIDSDVEALRPIDSLLGGVTAFLGRLGRRHVGNQVMGAVPHHPFFELAVERLAASVRGGGTASKVAGKAYLEQLLAERPEGVTIFPEETFYYEPSFEPPRHPDDFPNVYVVHHSLTSYSGAPPTSAMDRRFKKFGVRLERAMGLAEPHSEVEEAVRWLRRGVTKYEQGFRAQIHRVQGEREQAEGRLQELRRSTEATIRGLEERLVRANEQLAVLERRTVGGRLRRLLAHLRGG